MSSQPIDGAAAYTESFCEGIKPDPLLTVSEWADRERILPPVSSAEPGQWRTSRTPYLREIMDCLSPSSPVQRVTFIKGSQIGATETGNNWAGYVIAMAPGPMLVVQPSLTMAKRFSKQRIQPMIKNTLALSAKVQDARIRDSGNTTLVKQFPGGILVITGAESATGLRSMPVRYLFMDEVDAYPGDCDGEGDPCGLAEARTVTFSSRKKIYEASTPTEAGFSRIEKRYNLSDQRKYYVPCPFCREEQWLRWSQIVFEKNEKYRLIDDAKYRCAHCRELIEERYKTWMLEQGRWIAGAPGAGKPAGFFLSSLYSPLGWLSWNDIAQEFLDARKNRDVSALKVWTNTKLGELWEEEGITVDDAALGARREDYGIGDPLPDGVLLLVAGVDIQGDRIEATAWGFGLGEESWVIRHSVFRGNPETSLQVWRDLDDWLLRVYPHASGPTLRVAAACVDSGGHATQQVYDFCRKRESRRVWPIIGRAGAGLPLVKIGTRRTRAKVVLGIVGTDTAKGLLFSRLGLSEFGPGYVHFPRDVDDEWFRQLTAEKLMTKHVKGVPTRVWKQIRARNEALDCAVYAFAAYASLGANLERIASRFEAQSEQAAKEKPPVKATSPAEGVRLNPARRSPPRAKWSSTRW